MRVPIEEDDTATRKRRHEAGDHQQESSGDPIFTPDISKIPGFSEKGKFWRAAAGKLGFHAIYESIC